MIGKAVVPAFAAVVLAGVAVAGASAPWADPRPTATSTPGWNDGPSFRDELACFTYGEKTVWPVWECHHAKGVWTYRYWIEPATTRDV